VEKPRILPPGITNPYNMDGEMWTGPAKRAAVTGTVIVQKTPQEAKPPPTQFPRTPVEVVFINIRKMPKP